MAHLELSLLANMVYSKLPKLVKFGLVSSVSHLFLEDRNVNDPGWYIMRVSSISYNPHGGSGKVNRNFQSHHNPLTPFLWLLIGAGQSRRL